MELKTLKEPVETIQFINPPTKVESAENID